MDKNSAFCCSKGLLTNSCIIQGFIIESSRNIGKFTVTLQFKKAKARHVS